MEFYITCINIVTLFVQHCVVKQRPEVEAIVPGQAPNNKVAIAEKHDGMAGALLILLSAAGARLLFCFYHLTYGFVSQAETFSRCTPISLHRSFWYLVSSLQV